MDAETQHDQTPWYAIKLYSARQKAASQWFEEKELEYFVPMHYVDLELQGSVKHILRPVVSNLIFVKKAMEETAQMMADQAKALYLEPTHLVKRGVRPPTTMQTASPNIMNTV